MHRYTLIFKFLSIYTVSPIFTRQSTKLFQRKVTREHTVHKKKENVATEKSDCSLVTLSLLSLYFMRKKNCVERLN